MSATFRDINSVFLSFIKIKILSANDAEKYPHMRSINHLYTVLGEPVPDLSSGVFQLLFEVCLNGLPLVLSIEIFPFEPL